MNANAKTQDLTGSTHPKDKSHIELQSAIDRTDHFQNVF